MRSRIVVSLLLLPAMVGCATLLAKKTTPVSMNSNPVGAEVWIDGNRAGTTPVTVSLDHKNEHVVVFILDGYQEVSCRLNRKVGPGWVIVDVLLGIVPVIVDAATGSWHSLDSDVCNVQLPRGGGGGRHALTPRCAAAALVAALIQAGCQSSGEEACRPPTPRERPYPFTGVWQAGSRTPVCLFQRNPQTVVGEYRGLQAAGVVQPDGELVLSVADRDGGVTVYSVRLSGGDTLDVEVRVATPAALRDPAGRYIRRGTSP